MSSRGLFHLAFPVGNIVETKRFYVDGLGCTSGRETTLSVILNLYGHQLVAHVTKDDLSPQRGIYPRHFGMVFDSLDDWENLLKRAQSANLMFRQSPKHRFLGLITEHRTFFLEDPFYNLLEFKFYTHPEAIFGAHEFHLIGDNG